jgi:serine/threonine protein kinase
VTPAEEEKLRNQKQNSTVVTSAPSSHARIFTTSAAAAASLQPRMCSFTNILYRSQSMKDPTPPAVASDNNNDDDDEHLVAVKIFQKSVLKRMRTMERNKETRRVQIKTALETVEREVALMKKLSHPNLVEFYEVIDSPESDLLYMVSKIYYLIEYCMAAATSEVFFLSVCSRKLRKTALLLPVLNGSLTSTVRAKCLLV